MSPTSEAIAEAVAVIQRGGVIIYPTETIYGLGCDATNENAVQRLLEIKGRSGENYKPPPILIAGEEQLQLLVENIPDSAQQLMQKHWPGALTLVLPARSNLSALLTGESGCPTIGVRQTGHAIARALCEQSGVPLVATSANFSGATGRAAMPQSLDDIPQELKNKVDFLVDSGPVGGSPSTVVDCTAYPFRILRQGAVEL
jgi:L-threonylcarbamoyladenylate synthase